MTALVYDPRYHTFESWAALMVEQYAGQQLQNPYASSDWKEWDIVTGKRKRSED